MPRNGVFLPRDASVSSLTVQRVARSKTTRSAGAPSTSPTDPADPAAPPRRDRSPSTLAGPVVRASIARASGNRSGVDRGEEDAQRRLETADPVGRQPELDRLVDVGVGRVVGGHGVGGAIEERGKTGGRVLGRTERRVHAQR